MQFNNKLIAQAYLTISITFFLCIKLIAQTDSLWFSDGQVKIGNYKVSYNKQKVESKTNQKEEYDASSILMLSTKDAFYRSVKITITGNPAYYMAKRLVESNVRLYGINFPAGYFNTNSVPQSFFYFEKEGVLTYINKANLEAFYRDYFGSCFDAIKEKSLLYNENSITKVLNAYNKCLDPNAEEKLVESSLKVISISAFGGIHKLTHNPKYITYEDGKFKDDGSDFGIGLNFELRNNLNLGFDIMYSIHEVESPTIKTYINPGLIISEYNMVGAHINCSYKIAFGKIAVKPGLNVGFSKLFNYKETRIQPIVLTPPFNADYFTFEQLFYDFYPYLDLGYDITSKISLFTRLSSGVSLTKSRAGHNYFPDPSPEGNHNIKGGLIVAGFSIKMRGS
ncbi:MAG: hypothetical protein GC192_20735 [Bacteroidetes bacterium]|nr:hypothetical protein [Bacteroidota bacterium]